MRAGVDLSDTVSDQLRHCPLSEESLIGALATIVDLDPGRTGAFGIARVRRMYIYMAPRYNGV